MELSVPDRASTLIVGGGIVGVATAFFLAERGETDVVVLERDRLGAGSTKGGLGGIRHQFADELDVRLSQLATAFWRDFTAFTSSAHEFEQHGYLFIEKQARVAEPGEGTGERRSVEGRQALVGKALVGAAARPVLA